MLLDAELKEFNKKIAKLNVCKEKVEECEAIMESYREAQKSLAYYQEKHEEAAAVLKEYKLLTETSQQQSLEVSGLHKELAEAHKAAQQNFVELKRLSRVEKDCRRLEDELKQKNAEFFELLDQKTTLAYEIETIKEKLKTREVDLNEKLEQLEFQNVSAENALNVKTAEFLRFIEESTAQTAKLESEVKKICFFFINK